MANKTLAGAMRNGIDSGKFEKAKGYCQRANRQAIQLVYNSKYNSLMKGNARDTGFAMMSAGLAFKATELKERGGLQVGDILFKTYQPFGHVEIYLGDNQTGGNSSTTVGRVNGALGYRTLAQFGTVDIIGRLPDPNEQQEVARKPQITTTAEESTVVVSVWDGAKWNDKRLPSLLKGNSNYLPVQELLRHAKVSFSLSEWGDGTPNIRIANINQS